MQHLQYSVGAEDTEGEGELDGIPLGAGLTDGIAEIDGIADGIVVFTCAKASTEGIWLFSEHDVTSSARLRKADPLPASQ